MSVRLRPARSTDAGSVGAILSEFIDRTRWMPRIHSRAEDLAHAGMLIDRGWVTVAEDGRDVLGFVARSGPEIHALYVREAARDRGVGLLLLAEAQRDSDRLELWTFEANSGAHRFYERAGFALAERTDGARNDEGLPDRRYVWIREYLPASRHADGVAALGSPPPEGDRA